MISSLPSENNYYIEYNNYIDYGLVIAFEFDFRKSNAIRR